MKRNGIAATHDVFDDKN